MTFTLEDFTNINAKLKQIRACNQQLLDDATVTESANEDQGVKGLFGLTKKAKPPAHHTEHHVSHSKPKLVNAPTPHFDKDARYVQHPEGKLQRYGYHVYIHPETDGTHKVTAGRNNTLMANGLSLEDAKKAAEHVVRHIDRTSGVEVKKVAAATINEYIDSPVLTTIIESNTVPQEVKASGEIYLEKEQVPPQLRGSYTGSKFKVKVTDSMSIPIDAGLWSSGSKDTYLIIRLADGKAISPPGQSSSPFSGTRQEVPVKLEPGIAVVEHTIFRGKDLGLTFYVHPSDVAKLLPDNSTNDLSDDEKLVLHCIKSFTSSYRKQEFSRLSNKSEKVWNNLLDDLKAKGLVAKNGSITMSGKNAIINYHPPLQYT